MRKVSAIILVFVMIFAVGCTAGESVPGEDLILHARKEYAALDSAHVEVVNNETGEAEQVFIFKYDEKGMMTYSYVGMAEGIYLAQYNNGREQFTNDNGEIIALDASSLQFAAYSREVPYPMAGEGLILFYKKAVIAEGSYVEEHDGITEVHHRYDVSKIGEYDGEGELAGFDVTYRFGADGSLIDLTETTVERFEVDEQNSSVIIHSYTIYISERNEVARVENVVDISGVRD